MARLSNTIPSIQISDFHFKSPIAISLISFNVRAKRLNESFSIVRRVLMSCYFSARIFFSHSHLFWSHFIFRLHVFISDNLFFCSFGWLGISVFSNPGIHIYFCGCIAYDANVVAQSLLFSLSLSLFHFHLCSNSRNHHFRFYVYYVHFFSSSRIHIMKIYKLNLFLSFLFAFFSNVFWGYFC